MQIVKLLFMLYASPFCYFTLASSYWLVSEQYARDFVINDLKDKLTAASYTE